jgi:hypothetical protein
MKINAVIMNPVQSPINTSVPEDGELLMPAGANTFEERHDLAAILERSKPDEVEQPKSTLSDRSGALTRRMVASRHQGEVYAIISEAHKNLSEWLEASIGGDANAYAVIRRLRRLIMRASRKVSDLNREDLLRSRQRSAERKEQEFEAERLRNELKRRISERRGRERGYPGIAVRGVSFISHNTGYIPQGGDIGSLSPPPPVCSPATE